MSEGNADVSATALAPPLLLDAHDPGHDGPGDSSDGLLIAIATIASQTARITNVMMCRRESLSQYLNISMKGAPGERQITTLLVRQTFVCLAQFATASSKGEKISGGVLVISITHVVAYHQKHLYRGCLEKNNLACGLTL